jgi:two-component system chemotaxis response regulator CheB
LSDHRVRVVVVEDSLVQRTHLVNLLEAEGDIEVVSQAATAAEAIREVERCRPDVVTLDLNIPEGGGQLVIEQVMARTPTPILVLSVTIQDQQSTTAVEALVGGALVALPKPIRWTDTDEAHLRRTVRSLNRVPVIRHLRGHLRSVGREGAPVRSQRRVVAIAASTGGPAALATVLGDLGGLAAPVLVVQHLHPDFIDGLAAWMNRVSALPVEVARADQVLLAGHVYIGPGHVHLRLAAGLRVSFSAEPPSLHRPSADELFSSVARHAGRSGIGVILSGMGDDGAKGLLELSRQGGATLGQDEESSAVFGMPRAAVQIGAVTRLLPPGKLGRAILAMARAKRT